MKKNSRLINLLVVLLIYGCNATPNNINVNNDKPISTSSPANNNSSLPTVSPSGSNLQPSQETRFDPKISEFKIGKSIASFQGEVSTALNDDGSSITTWSAVEGTAINIYAQRFNKDFQPEGDEFKVNTRPIPANESSYIPLIKYMYISPKVTLDTDKGFIISWVNEGKLLLRKYDKNGNTIKNEINPKFNLKGQQFDVIGAQRGKNIVLPDENGRYFIVGSGVSGQDFSPGYGQLFDNNFNPINDVVKLPADPLRTYAGRYKDDNILLVFWRYDDSIGNLSLYGQRYKSDITPIGEQFKVNDIGGEYSKLIGFTVDNEGNFLMSGAVRNNNMINWDTYLQRYDLNNNQVNFESVNTENLEFNHLPTSQISINNNGDFVIAWGNEDIDYSTGEIYARRYDKTGKPKEKEFKVNYLSKGFKDKPDVSLNNNGDFLVVWPNWNDNDSSYSIYGRKYNISQTLPNDDPALIPQESVDCQPNQQQAREIQELKPFTGDLRIKVKDNNQSIQLKTAQDFKNISEKIKNEQGIIKASINGQPYMYSSNSLTARLTKSGCFEQIFSRYNIKKPQDSSGFYYIYPDYKEIPLDGFEQSLRKFIVKENLQVNEIEFSSPNALAAFYLYMELKLNYSYLFEHLYLSPIVSTT